MIIIIYIYILYLRVIGAFETSIIKFPGYVFYIYLGVIVVNLLVKLILLGIAEIDIVPDLCGSNCSSHSNSPEIYDNKIILKISPDNSDLVQGEIKTIESNNKIDSVQVNDNKEECKGKNQSFLKDLHKRLQLEKSHFPSHFQKNVLPKIPEDVPVYTNKIVTFKPTSILENRNLPEMSIEIPKSTSVGKLTELNKAISGADEAIELYDSQFIKFNKVLSGIKDGTEVFYPKEAKPLMETYIDFVAKLTNQQKVMANEAINQLQKLDPKFTRGLYFVDNNAGAVSDVNTGTVSATASGYEAVGTIER